MRARTWKVIVEFPDPESALAWFDEIHAAGHLPQRAELFEADALDLHGRANVGDYVVKSRLDRPGGHALRTLVEQRAAARTLGVKVPEQRPRRPQRTPEAAFVTDSNGDIL